MLRNLDPLRRTSGSARGRFLVLHPANASRIACGFVLVVLLALGLPAATEAREGNPDRGRVLAHLDWDRSASEREVRFVPGMLGGEVWSEGRRLLDFEPRFAAAGDFDADGFQDLVVAEGSRWALLRGSVDGLGEPQIRSLPGSLLELAVGEVNRLDGLEDLVVAIQSTSVEETWSEVFVFEGPHGAWNAEPERHRLEGEVARLSFQPGKSALRDLRVGFEDSSQDLLIVGRDRKLTRRLGERAGVPAAEWRWVSPLETVEKEIAQKDGFVGAEMFVVNSGGDAGGASCPLTCTLRAAVAGANANPGSTITFSVSTVAPLTTPVVATAPVTILGAGAVTLDGSAVFGGCPLITQGAASVVDGLIYDSACLDVQGDGSTVTGSYFGMDASSTELDFASLQINSNSNTIGGTALADRNYFGHASLSIFECDNTLQGNYFGVDTTGTARVGSFGHVSLSIVSDCTALGPTLVGGTAAGAGNLFADTLFINGGADGTTVQGNLFGVSADGTALIPSTDATAIEITGGDNSLIGGTSAAAGNVISGNATSFLFGYGIHVKPGADGTVVQGNTIGTNLAGTADLGNWRNGIFLDIDSDFEADTTIGGAVAGAGNLISGSSEDGIYVFNVTGGPFTGPVVISGNKIGTNAAATAAIPNGSNGIRNQRMENTVIGGATAAEANIIGGNIESGIDLDSQTVVGVTVQGNFIGTDTTGTIDLGNGDHGVFVDDANDCTIGGSGTGEGNTIAFNGDDGVRVSGTVVAQGEGNRISRNRIFSNVDLGINLSGGNDGQEAPDLTTALSTPATVSGSLDSSASTEFTLEFFASTACDAGGAGEGERFLGSAMVTTDGTGSVSFDLEVGGTLAAGEVMTATATDPDGNTSEFSDCVTATVNTALIFTDGFESGDTTAWSSAVP